MRTNFNQTTKNMYKQNEREINVTGKLYLANKRKSLNLFNKYIYQDIANIRTVTVSNINENVELMYSPTTITD